MAATRASARNRAGAQLRGKLAKAMGRAIADFSMIHEGDRILCAVSGGKDSFALHQLLADLQRRAPVQFELLAVNVDQGHPHYPRDVLHRYMEERNYPFRMVFDDTYSIVRSKVPEGDIACPLCSRLRRGILYRVARESNFNKIALGHHRDDVVTTLMLNLLFAGQLKAMPPKLVNDQGDIEVVRPLTYCAESDLAAYARAENFPIIPCNLCGSQPNQQRAVVGAMLAELDARHPGVRASMLAALRNVRPSHLLDAALWRKLGLAVAEDEHCGERPTPVAVPVQLGEPGGERDVG